jgi:DNA-binding XRE family transcriptional regulator
MARDTFGARLRSLRELAGLSQSQLAEKVGTDEYHVSGWEQDFALPELAMVDLLAAALGVFSRRRASPRRGICSGSSATDTGGGHRCVVARPAAPFSGPPLHTTVRSLRPVGALGARDYRSGSRTRG